VSPPTATAPNAAQTREATTSIEVPLLMAAHLYVTLLPASDRN
jgi:hypothetical protein